MEVLHFLGRVKGWRDLLNLLPGHQRQLPADVPAVFSPNAAKKRMHLIGGVRPECPELGQLEVVHVAVAEWGQFYASCMKISTTLDLNC